MNVVLLGVPGAGKGTQAEFMIKKHGMMHISTGDLLREAINQGTQYGKQANEYMQLGALVPDQLVIDIMKEKFNNTDISNGLILDGFPRTTEQAQDLDIMMQDLNSKIDLAILIDAPTDLIIQRICSRRMCKSCGHIGSVYGLSAEEADNYSCSECGGQMYQRDDDNQKTVENRIEVYLEKTTPVIQYYEEQNKLKKVNGGLGSPQEVFKELEKLLD